MTEQDLSTIEGATQYLESLSPEEREKVLKEVGASTSAVRWTPSPGPQLDAYLSKADVLLFGGEPGGGKSALIIGLAFNEHKRSLIMRRQYTDLGSLIEYSQLVKGDKVGFNGSPPPKFQLSEDQVINFGAAQNVGDEMSWMGRARDLLGLDEATQFAESQVRFLMGWIRHEDPKQRCRAVLATNPPLNPEGLWIVKMFAPWLDENYPNPALPGELRWAVSDDDDPDRWVDGPEPVLAMVDGVEKLVEPLSRTFIPSSMKDNPFYAAGGYQKQLDALPAEIRSKLMGGFKSAFVDDPMQTIPTMWVDAAMKRWTKHPPEGIPMSSMGIDPSGGGRDPLAIARRHDWWYDEMLTVPGKTIPKDKIGSTTTAHVIMHRKDRCKIVLDLGGGFGAAALEVMTENNLEVVGYKGNTSTPRKSEKEKWGFGNLRSEAFWRLREALDPEQAGGSDLALPPDAELRADLCAPKWSLKGNTVHVEPKDEVCKRLGRSTNKGDTVIMAWMHGPKMVQPGEAWHRKRQSNTNRPKVIMKGGRR